MSGGGQRRALYLHSKQGNDNNSFSSVSFSTLIVVIYFGQQKCLRKLKILPSHGHPKKKRRSGETKCFNTKFLLSILLCVKKREAVFFKRKCFIDFFYFVFSVIFYFYNLRPHFRSVSFINIKHRNGFKVLEDALDRFFYIIFYLVVLYISVLILYYFPECENPKKPFAITDLIRSFRSY